MKLDRDGLRARYHAVRAATEGLAAPLSAEDQQLQSMPACSPTRWHRAHTTWFFEAFILGPCGVEPHDPRYAYLYNSYYEGVGPRHPRPRRGMISRPSLAEITRWRALVDERMDRLLATADAPTLARIAPLVGLGLAHEEQHQELILTDILHALSENPLLPAYREGGAPTSRWPGGVASQPGRRSPSEEPGAPAGGWRTFDGGPAWIGAADPGLVFDNEGPRHRAWLEPYSLATRLVTVGEAKAFARDGGYGRASLWLSEGLDFVRQHGISAPGYVTVDGDDWLAFGLDGVRALADDEPVTHLSWYEADALARFLGARLPTEAEWENAVGTAPVEGNFRDSGLFRPRGGDGWFGDAWQWTASPYASYPGYRPAPGVVGEYNGKFMVNQIVLRGGSFLTPPGHVRATYRNFWHPDTRFQVTGLRLARDER